MARLLTEHVIIVAASKPPFSERSKISNSVRASNLAWLPPAVHSNYSERLWLHAWTFLVALENRALVGQENQIEDIRFLFSPSTTPPLWPPKREYNAVSAERSMKFDNIVRVETLRYLTKITALRRKADREGSCSQAIRLRYNYYVQLVAIKRGRVRVANSKLRSARQRGGGKLVVQCTVAYRKAENWSMRE